MHSATLAADLSRVLSNFASDFPTSSKGSAIQRISTLLLRIVTLYFDKRSQTVCLYCVYEQLFHSITQQLGLWDDILHAFSTEDHVYFGHKCSKSSQLSQHDGNTTSSRKHMPYFISTSQSQSGEDVLSGDQLAQSQVPPLVLPYIDLPSEYIPIDLTDCISGLLLGNIYLSIMFPRVLQSIPEEFRVISPPSACILDLYWRLTLHLIISLTRIACVRQDILLEILPLLHPIIDSTQFDDILPHHLPSITDVDSKDHPPQGTSPSAQGTKGREGNIHEPTQHHSTGQPSQDTFQAAVPTYDSAQANIAMATRVTAAPAVGLGQPQTGSKVKQLPIEVLANPTVLHTVPIQPQLSSAEQIQLQLMEYNETLRVPASAQPIGSSSSESSSSSSSSSSESYIYPPPQYIDCLKQDLPVILREIISRLQLSATPLTSSAVYTQIIQKLQHNYSTHQISQLYHEDSIALSMLPSPPIDLLLINAPAWAITTFHLSEHIHALILALLYPQSTLFLDYFIHQQQRQHCNTFSQYSHDTGDEFQSTQDVVALAYADIIPSLAVPPSRSAGHQPSYILNRIQWEQPLSLMLPFQSFAHTKGNHDRRITSLTHSLVHSPLTSLDFHLPNQLLFSPRSADHISLLAFGQVSSSHLPIGTGRTSSPLSALLPMKIHQELWCTFQRSLMLPSYGYTYSIWLNLDPNSFINRMLSSKLSHHHPYQPLTSTSGDVHETGSPQQQHADDSHHTIVTLFTLQTTSLDIIITYNQSTAVISISGYVTVGAEPASARDVDDHSDHPFPNPSNAIHLHHHACGESNHAKLASGDTVSPTNSGSRPAPVASQPPHGARYQQVFTHSLPSLGNILNDNQFHHIAISHQPILFDSTQKTLLGSLRSALANRTKTTRLTQVENIGRLSLFLDGIAIATLNIPYPRVDSFNFAQQKQSFDAQLSRLQQYLDPQLTVDQHVLHLVNEGGKARNPSSLPKLAKTLSTIITASSSGLTNAFGKAKQKTLSRLAAPLGSLQRWHKSTSSVRSQSSTGSTTSTTTEAKGGTIDSSLSFFSSVIPQCAIASAVFICEPLSPSTVYSFYTLGVEKHTTPMITTGYVVPTDKRSLKHYRTQSQPILSSLPANSSVLDVTRSLASTYTSPYPHALFTDAPVVSETALLRKTSRWLNMHDFYTQMLPLDYHPLQYLVHCDAAVRNALASSPSTASLPVVMALTTTGLPASYPASGPQVASPTSAMTTLPGGHGQAIRPVSPDGSSSLAAAPAAAAAAGYMTTIDPMSNPAISSLFYNAINPYVTHKLSVDPEHRFNVFSRLLKVTTPNLSSSTPSSPIHAIHPSSIASSSHPPPDQVVVGAATSAAMVLSLALCKLILEESQIQNVLVYLPKKTMSLALPIALIAQPQATPAAAPYLSSSSRSVPHSQQAGPQSEHPLDGLNESDDDDDDEDLSDEDEDDSDDDDDDDEDIQLPQPDDMSETAIQLRLIYQQQERYRLYYQLQQRAKRARSQKYNGYVSGLVVSTFYTPSMLNTMATTTMYALIPHLSPFFLSASHYSSPQGQLSRVFILLMLLSNPQTSNATMQLTPSVIRCVIFDPICVCQRSVSLLNITIQIVECVRRTYIDSNINTVISTFLLLLYDFTYWRNLDQDALTVLSEYSIQFLLDPEISTYLRQSYFFQLREQQRAALASRIGTRYSTDASVKLEKKHILTIQKLHDDIVRLTIANIRSIHRFHLVAAELGVMLPSVADTFGTSSWSHADHDVDSEISQYDQYKLLAGQYLQQQYHFHHELMTNVMGASQPFSSLLSSESLHNILVHLHNIDSASYLQQQQQQQQPQSKAHTAQKSTTNQNPALSLASSLSNPLELSESSMDGEQQQRNSYLLSTRDVFQSTCPHQYIDKLGISHRFDSPRAVGDVPNPSTPSTSDHAATSQPEAHMGGGIDTASIPLLPLTLATTQSSRLLLSVFTQFKPTTLLVDSIYSLLSDCLASSATQMAVIPIIGSLLELIIFFITSESDNAVLQLFQMLSSQHNQSVLLKLIAMLPVYHDDSLNRAVLTLCSQLLCIAGNSISQLERELASIKLPSKISAINRIKREIAMKQEQIKSYQMYSTQLTTVITSSLLFSGAKFVQPFILTTLLFRQLCVKGSHQHAQAQHVHQRQKEYYENNPIALRVDYGIAFSTSYYHSVYTSKYLPQALHYSEEYLEYVHSTATQHESFFMSHGTTSSSSPTSHQTPRKMDEPSDLFDSPSYSSPNSSSASILLDVDFTPQRYHPILELRGILGPAYQMLCNAVRLLTGSSLHPDDDRLYQQTVMETAQSSSAQHMASQKSHFSNHNVNTSNTHFQTELHPDDMSLYVPTTSPQMFTHLTSLTGSTNALHRRLTRGSSISHPHPPSLEAGSSGSHRPSLSVSGSIIRPQSSQFHASGSGNGNDTSSMATGTASGAGNNTIDHIQHGVHIIIPSLPMVDIIELLTMYCIAIQQSDGFDVDADDINQTASSTFMKSFNTASPSSSPKAFTNDGINGSDDDGLHSTTTPWVDIPVFMASSQPETYSTLLSASLLKATMPILVHYLRKAVLLPPHEQLDILVLRTMDALRPASLGGGDGLHDEMLVSSPSHLSEPTPALHLRDSSTPLASRRMPDTTKLTGGVVSPMHTQHTVDGTHLHKACHRFLNDLLSFPLPVPAKHLSLTTDDPSRQSMQLNQPSMTSTTDPAKSPGDHDTHIPSQYDDLANTVSSLASVFNDQLLSTIHQQHPVLQQYLPLYPSLVTNRRTTVISALTQVLAKCFVFSLPSLELFLDVVLGTPDVMFSFLVDCPATVALRCNRLRSHANHSQGPVQYPVLKPIKQCLSAYLEHLNSPVHLLSGYPLLSIAYLTQFGVPSAQFYFASRVLTLLSMFPDDTTTLCSMMTSSQSNPNLLNILVVLFLGALRGSAAVKRYKLAKQIMGCINDQISSTAGSDTLLDRFTFSPTQQNELIQSARDMTADQSSDTNYITFTFTKLFTLILWKFIVDNQGSSALEILKLSFDYAYNFYELSTYGFETDVTVSEQHHPQTPSSTPSIHHQNIDLTPSSSGISFSEPILDLLHDHREDCPVAEFVTSDPLICETLLQLPDRKDKKAIYLPHLTYTMMQTIEQQFSLCNCGRLHAVKKYFYYRHENKHLVDMSFAKPQVDLSHTSDNGQQHYHQVSSWSRAANKVFDVLTSVTKQYNIVLSHYSYTSPLLRYTNPDTLPQSYVDVILTSNMQPLYIVPHSPSSTGRSSIQLQEQREEWAALPSSQRHKMVLHTIRQSTIPMSYALHTTLQTLPWPHLICTRDMLQSLHTSIQLYLLRYAVPFLPSLCTLKSKNMIINNPIAHTQTQDYIHEQLQTLEEQITIHEQDYQAKVQQHPPELLELKSADSFVNIDFQSTPQPQGESVFSQSQSIDSASIDGTSHQTAFGRDDGYVIDLTSPPPATSVASSYQSTLDDSGLVVIPSFDDDNSIIDSKVVTDAGKVLPWRDPDLQYHAPIPVVPKLIVPSDSTVAGQGGLDTIQQESALTMFPSTFNFEMVAVSPKPLSSAIDIITDDLAFDNELLSLSLSLVSNDMSMELLRSTVLQKMLFIYTTPEESGERGRESTSATKKSTLPDARPTRATFGQSGESNNLHAGKPATTAAGTTGGSGTDGSSGSTSVSYQIQGARTIRPLKHGIQQLENISQRQKHILHQYQEINHLLDHTSARQDQLYDYLREFNPTFHDISRTFELEVINNVPSTIPSMLRPIADRDITAILRRKVLVYAYSALSHLEMHYFYRPVSYYISALGHFSKWKASYHQMCELYQQYASTLPHQHPLALQRLPSTSTTNHRAPTLPALPTVPGFLTLDYSPPLPSSADLEAILWIISASNSLFNMTTNKAIIIRLLFLTCTHVLPLPTSYALIQPLCIALHHLLCVRLFNDIIIPTSDAPSTAGGKPPTASTARGPFGGGNTIPSTHTKAGEGGQSNPSSSPRQHVRQQSLGGDAQHKGQFTAQIYGNTRSSLSTVSTGAKENPLRRSFSARPTSAAEEFTSYDINGEHHATALHVPSADHISLDKYTQNIGTVLAFIYAIQHALDYLEVGLIAMFTTYEASKLASEAVQSPHERNASGTTPISHDVLTEHEFDQFATLVKTTKVENRVFSQAAIGKDVKSGQYSNDNAFGSTVAENDTTVDMSSLKTPFERRLHQLVITPPPLPPAYKKGFVDFHKYLHDQTTTQETLTIQDYIVSPDTQHTVQQRVQHLLAPVRSLLLNIQVLWNLVTPQSVLHTVNVPYDPSHVDDVDSSFLRSNLPSFLNANAKRSLSRVMSPQRLFTSASGIYRDRTSSPTIPLSPKPNRDMSYSQNVIFGATGSTPDDTSNPFAKMSTDSPMASPVVIGPDTPTRVPASRVAFSTSSEDSDSATSTEGVVRFQDEQDDMDIPLNVSLQVTMAEIPIDEHVLAIESSSDGEGNANADDDDTFDHDSSDEHGQLMNVPGIDLMDDLATVSRVYNTTSGHQSSDQDHNDGSARLQSSHSKILQLSPIHRRDNTSFLIRNPSSVNRLRHRQDYHPSRTSGGGDAPLSPDPSSLNAFAGALPPSGPSMLSRQVGQHQLTHSTSMVFSQPSGASDLHQSFSLSSILLPLSVTPFAKSSPDHAGVPGQKKTVSLAKHQTPPNTRVFSLIPPLDQTRTHRFHPLARLRRVVAFPSILAIISQSISRIIQQVDTTHTTSVQQAEEAYHGVITSFTSNLVLRYRTASLLSTLTLTSPESGFLLTFHPAATRFTLLSMIPTVSKTLSQYANGGFMHSLQDTFSTQRTSAALVSPMGSRYQPPSPTSSSPSSSRKTSRQAAFTFKTNTPRFEPSLTLSSTRSLSFMSSQRNTSSDIDSPWEVVLHPSTLLVPNHIGPFYILLPSNLTAAHVDQPLLSYPISPQLRQPITVSPQCINMDDLESGISLLWGGVSTVITKGMGHYTVLNTDRWNRYIMALVLQHKYPTLDRKRIFKLVYLLENVDYGALFTDNNAQLISAMITNGNDGISPVHASSSPIAGKPSGSDQDPQSTSFINLEFLFSTEYLPESSIMNSDYSAVNTILHGKFLIAPYHLIFAKALSWYRLINRFTLLGNDPDDSLLLSSTTATASAEHDAFGSRQLTDHAHLFPLETSQISIDDHDLAYCDTMLMKTLWKTADTNNSARTILQQVFSHVQYSQLQNIIHYQQTLSMSGSHAKRWITTVKYLEQLNVVSLTPSMHYLSAALQLTCYDNTSQPNTDTNDADGAGGVDTNNAGGNTSISPSISSKRQQQHSCGTSATSQISAIPSLESFPVGLNQTILPLMHSLDIETMSLKSLVVVSPHIVEFILQSIQLTNYQSADKKAVTNTLKQLRTIVQQQQELYLKQQLELLAMQPQTPAQQALFDSTSDPSLLTSRHAAMKNSSFRVDEYDLDEISGSLHEHAIVMSLATDSISKALNVAIAENQHRKDHSEEELDPAEKQRLEALTKRGVDGDLAGNAEGDDLVIMQSSPPTTERQLSQDSTDSNAPSQSGDALHETSSTTLDGVKHDELLIEDELGQIRSQTSENLASFLGEKTAVPSTIDRPASGDSDTQEHGQSSSPHSDHRRLDALGAFSKPARIDSISLEPQGGAKKPTTKHHQSVFTSLRNHHQQQHQQGKMGAEQQHATAQGYYPGADPLASMMLGLPPQEDITDSKLCARIRSETPRSFAYPAVYISQLLKYAGVLMCVDDTIEFHGSYIPEVNTANLTSMHRLYSHYVNHPLHYNPAYIKDKDRGRTIRINIKLNQVKLILPKPYMTRTVGLEITAFSGRSYFFSFTHPDQTDAMLWERGHLLQDNDDIVYQRDNLILNSQTAPGTIPTEIPQTLWSSLPQNFDVTRRNARRMERQNRLAFNTGICYLLSRPPGGAPEDRPEILFARNRWCKGELSNFDYLMILNMYSGRSFHDLSQYPIFPWVLTNYTSSSIDLADHSNYRDLSKPVGALDEDRFEMFLDRYETAMHDSQGGTGAFLYGSHYMPLGIVLFYLLRTFPLAIANGAMQGHRFDISDRLFKSIPATFKDSLTSLSDVKEVIPEFYMSPNFLTNNNGILDLGVPANYIDRIEREDALRQKQRELSGASPSSIASPQANANTLIERIGDVELPPWAHSPRHFISTMRAALESPYVSVNLHLWIDLIFGYKQSSPHNVPAHNLFPNVTYQSTFDVDLIADPHLRKAAEDQILFFGLCPLQLFSAAHPPRDLVGTHVHSRLLFDWRRYWNQVVIFNAHHHYRRGLASTSQSSQRRQQVASPSDKSGVNRITMQSDSHPGSVSDATTTQIDAAVDTVKGTSDSEIANQIEELYDLDTELFRTSGESDLLNIGINEDDEDEDEDDDDDDSHADVYLVENDEETIRLTNHSQSTTLSTQEYANNIIVESLEKIQTNDVSPSPTTDQMLLAGMNGVSSTQDLNDMILSARTSSQSHTIGGDRFSSGASRQISRRSIGEQDRIYFDTQLSDVAKRHLLTEYVEVRTGADDQPICPEVHSQYLELVLGSNAVELDPHSTPPTTPTARASSPVGHSDGISTHKITSILSPVRPVSKLDHAGQVEPTISGSASTLLAKPTHQQPMSQQQQPLTVGDINNVYQTLTSRYSISKHDQILLNARRVTPKTKSSPALTPTGSNSLDTHPLSLENSLTNDSFGSLDGATQPGTASTKASQASSAPQTVTLPPGQISHYSFQTVALLPTYSTACGLSLQSHAHNWTIVDAICSSTGVLTHIVQCLDCGDVTTEAIYLNTVGSSANDNNAKDVLPLSSFYTSPLHPNHKQAKHLALYDEITLNAELKMNRGAVTDTSSHPHQVSTKDQHPYASITSPLKHYDINDELLSADYIRSFLPGEISPLAVALNPTITFLNDLIILLQGKGLLFQGRFLHTSSHQARYKIHRSIASGDYGYGGADAQLNILYRFTSIHPCFFPSRHTTFSIPLQLSPPIDIATILGTPLQFSSPLLVATTLNGLMSAVVSHCLTMVYLYTFHFGAGRAILSSVTRICDPPATITSICFAQNEATLYLGCSDGSLSVFSIMTDAQNITPYVFLTPQQYQSYHQQVKFLQYKKEPQSASQRTTLPPPLSSSDGLHTSHTAALQQALQIESHQVDIKRLSHSLLMGCRPFISIQLSKPVIAVASHPNIGFMTVLIGQHITLNRPIFGSIGGGSGSESNSLIAAILGPDGVSHNQSGVAPSHLPLYTREALTASGPSAPLTPNQALCGFQQAIQKVNPFIREISVSPHAADRSSAQELCVVSLRLTSERTYIQLPGDCNVTQCLITPLGNIVVYGQKVVDIRFVIDRNATSLKDSNGATADPSDIMEYVIHKSTHSFVSMFDNHGTHVNTHIIPDVITTATVNYYSSPYIYPGSIYIATLSGSILVYGGNDLSPLFCLTTYGPPPHFTPIGTFLHSLHLYDQAQVQCACCCPYLYHRDLSAFIARHGQIYTDTSTTQLDSSTGGQAPPTQQQSKPIMDDTTDKLSRLFQADFTSVHAKLPPNFRRHQRGVLALNTTMHHDQLIVHANMPYIHDMTLADTLVVWAHRFFIRHLQTYTPLPDGISAPIMQLHSPAALRSLVFPKHRDLLSNIPIPPSLLIYTYGEREIDPYFNSFINLSHHRMQNRLQAQLQHTSSALPPSTDAHSITTQQSVPYKTANIYLPYDQTAAVFAHSSLLFSTMVITQHGYHICRYTQEYQQDFLSPMSMPRITPQSSREQMQFQIEQDLSNAIQSLSPPRPQTLRPELMVESVSAITALQQIAAKMSYIQSGKKDYARDLSIKMVRELDGHRTDLFERLPSIVKDSLVLADALTDLSFFYLNYHESRHIPPVSPRHSTAGRPTSSSSGSARSPQQNQQRSSPSTAGSTSLGARTSGNGHSSAQYADAHHYDPLSMARIGTRVLLFPLSAFSLLPNMYDETAGRDVVSAVHHTWHAQQQQYDQKRQKQEREVVAKYKEEQARQDKRSKGGTLGSVMGWFSSKR